MARFLLIHGASHGAWCWDRLSPLLSSRGHVVEAIDLPGHGDDKSPQHGVRLQDYVDRVLEHLTPGTCLVGHSFGGFPITLAAARRPDLVHALVYLCALLPRSGEAFTAFRNDAISPDVSAAQMVDRDAGVTHAMPDKAGAVFYSDCTPDDQAWATARLTPQPIGVMTEAPSFTTPDLPRHYIRCLRDRVVFPAYQSRVSQNWRYTYDLTAGHSPFLSQPDALATVLDQIARA
ncbi:MAG: alpha/beta fold hydrolase [Pseudomonadota bacterium]